MQVKKDDVKDRILKSARHEFSKYGYHNASMVRLASRAKMSVGNVYKYFKNKDALLDAVVAEVFYILPAGLKGLIEQNAGIDEFTDYINELFENYPIELQILTQNTHGSKYDGVKDRFIETVYEQIERAFSGKEFNPKTVGAIASGAIECILNLLIGEKNKKERKKQLSIALYFYFNDLENRLNYAVESAQK